MLGFTASGNLCYAQAARHREQLMSLGCFATTGGYDKGDLLSNLDTHVVGFC